MGYCDKDIGEVVDILEQLKIEYMGSTYDMLRRNCNHFCEDLVRRLLDKPVPSYINRLAKTISTLGCFFPLEFFTAGNQTAAMKRPRKNDSICLALKRLRKADHVRPLDSRKISDLDDIQEVSSLCESSAQQSIIQAITTQQPLHVLAFVPNEC
eukprot:TRINITY_DN3451_c0_g1_i2.p1 TRINITY_DN3451_c0_g1~~TRINITY_DN3451_c0_g1_i2.p1  ORF type:complete len:154 (-),score=32.39 TRINITY_DN3451_c0_g1_i2:17-478(-)